MRKTRRVRVCAAVQRRRASEVRRTLDRSETVCRRLEAEIAAVVRDLREPSPSAALLPPLEL